MTQHLAIARIGLALVIWAEWMGPIRPVHHLMRPDLLAWMALVWLGTGLMVFGLFSRLAAALTGVSVLVVCCWAGVAQGVGGGGVALGSLEAWMLGLGCLGLAFTPCGASLSVDAVLGRAPGRENGGVWFLRALLSTTFLGLALSHANADFLTGRRFEAVWLARYDAPPLPTFLRPLLGILWWSIELALGVAPWVRSVYAPAYGFGLMALGGAYSCLYLGTFPAVVGVVALAAWPSRICSRT